MGDTDEVKNVEFASSHKEREITVQILAYMNNIRCNYSMLDSVTEMLDNLEANGFPVGASKEQMEKQLFDMQGKMDDFMGKLAMLRDELGEFASQIKPPKGMLPINFTEYADKYEEVDSDEEPSQIPLQRALPEFSGFNTISDT